MSAIHVEVGRPSLVYLKTHDAIQRTARFVSSVGGTRSGKTYANLQAIFELAVADKTPTITSVVSETFPHLKRGAIRDFALALGDAYDERCWNKSSSTYTVPGSGSIIEFFSADSPAKVHGPARDRLFLNEVQNIPWETARQLFVRTRGLVILDYNPTHDFWAQQEIEPRKECITIHSTFEDNKDAETGVSFLSPEQIQEILANKHDSNWWRVYGLGLLGSLDGLIYPDFELIDEMPEGEKLREIGGIDFGFSDPTAIVRVLADHGRKTAYIDEIAYRKQMKNDAIVQALQEAGFARTTNIWADCEDARAIAEIAAASRLKVIACNKSAPVRSDKRKFQIQWMQGWRLCVTKRSLNVIKDLRNYAFEKDADGKTTSFPIHDWSHGPDAMRYALYSEFAGRESAGNYSFSVIR